MTYKEFKEKYNGKVVDYDGYYGGQCWDLGQYYFTKVLNLPASVLSGCGLVSNMLKGKKRELMDKYFDEVKVSEMQQGDVAIWEYGHIAIFDSKKGNKNYYFSQNPNPSKVMVITTGGVHAFRLKGTKKVQTTTSTITQSISFKKGDKIVLNGYLYKDSAGNGKGAYKTNYKGSITIVNTKGSKPYHIDSLGWVAAKDIKKQTTSATNTKKGTLTVNPGSWNVRKGAGMNYAVVKVVKGGTKLNYYGTSNGWYKIDSGYIGPKAVKVN